MLSLDRQVLSNSLPPEISGLPDILHGWTFGFTFIASMPFARRTCAISSCREVGLNLGLYGMGKLQLVFWSRNK